MLKRKHPVSFRTRKLSSSRLMILSPYGGGKVGSCPDSFYFMDKKTRLAVFVSGSGTNLQAIIDAKISSIEIAVVLSNNPGAYAIERAKKHGISVEVVEHRNYSSREEFEKEILTRLESYNIDLIALAGFMRILSPPFIRAWKFRIMNLHPALLPSFPGTHAAKQALDYGVKFTGCTVHFVDEGVDTGPIILQTVVPIYDTDTEESLLGRIHKEEHRIYPEAIRLFAEGKLEIEGRRVFIRD
jgi:phosphoribosylglycinamide formyltransferase 1